MQSTAVAHEASPAGLAADLAGAQSALERKTLAPVELIGLTERLLAARRHGDAVALYRRWLTSCRSPLDHVVQFNLGVALSAVDQLAEAEHAYRAALALAPGFPQACFNLGSVVERLGRPQEALEIWQALLDRLAANPAFHELHLLTLNSLGRLLEQTRELERAQAFLRRSLELSPRQPNVIQHWVHLRQKQCEWPVYAPFAELSDGDLWLATSPLAMLSASDDPGLQLAAAHRFAAQRVNARGPLLAPAQGYRHERLRLGFLSSDFCLHAVSLLTVELFELLDRQRFELHGFCWSREDGSQLRARVRSAMEHFVPIGGLDDAAAAQRIRACEIDVLIDLHGLTSGARPDILAARPAPVQATYLGFPGSTGLPCIDYVIADRYVIPDAERPFYSETPLYLPEVFQCCDRQRPVGALPTRAQSGLPEQGFVFCSFNNNHKFNPETLACWARILQRVPQSVLWLVGDNRWSEQNLVATVRAHGVAAERIHFAPRVAPPDYLARYRVADLFLDTYPFNAGATANDALWMGLPVLTRSGRTFASRMAGALLTALKLPELITRSLEEYEERAVQLATQPQLLAGLAQRLAQGRQSSALFDMPRFVRGFEEALLGIARRA